MYPGFIHPLDMVVPTQCFFGISSIYYYHPLLFAHASNKLFTTITVIGLVWRILAKHPTILTLNKRSQVQISQATKRICSLFCKAGVLVKAFDMLALLVYYVVMATV